MKTYFVRKEDVQQDWYIIDATDVVLGRLAVEVAKIIRGKNKPSYTPHNNCGDNVVIINADKVYLTGNKMTDKVYYRHTGHPGGIKSTTPAKLLETKPEEIIKLAVKRMVPTGPLGRDQLRNLKVFVGSEHDHEAQKPVVIDMAKLNDKNIKRG